MFETLDSLGKDASPEQLARAKAVSEVAHTIIESAKVEVQYIKTVREETGADVRSAFFPAPNNGRKALPSGPERTPEIGEDRTGIRTVRQIESKRA